MAYTIDIYRGRQVPTRNFVSFALYVSYFPQLVAGPIERSTHLLPQIEGTRQVTRQDWSAAVDLCISGFFKKVFIADGVATVVNGIFAHSDTQSAFSLLIGVYLFALQIYGDFSGYSDIARGISRLFGIRLCVNFRQPYFSANISDFWRRWHISLSTWLRDYLYIPLGGNRKGVFRTYVNLMLTMLLGGLWHGADWKFMIWGGLHGLYLSIHKWLLNERPPAPPRPIPFRHSVVWLAGVVATFHLVCLTWIFFRSDSLSQSVNIVARIFSLANGAFSLQSLAYCMVYGSLTVLLDGLCRYRDQESPFAAFHHMPVLKGMFYATAIFLMICVGDTHAQPFIYFQF